MDASTHKMKILISTLFYFFTGAIMVSLFFATVIQGILIHLEGNSLNAAIHYFIATLSLGAGVMIYLRGKKLLWAL